MTVGAEATALKKDALRLWSNDRASLLLEQPFIAQLALQLDLVPVVDDRLPTAATDGRSVFVNAEFLLGLSPAERIFVLAHEIWHCVLGHFGRRGDRDPGRWNLAVDHEVNALLKGQGLHVPAGCVYFRRWDDLNAEEVYARLDVARLCGGDGERGPFADRHELAEDGGPCSARVDPDYAPVRDGFRDWPQRVVSTVRQIERTGGTLPGRARILVERLTKPRIAWREVVRRFAAQATAAERSWRRFDRRLLPQGLYLPGREVRRPTLAVALDVSGSTSALLSAFLGELSGLLTSGAVDAVRVIACDTEISLDTVLHPAEASTLGTLTLRGHGGTDFRPVFARLAASDEAPHGLIFFTDGFGSAPASAPVYPVLWAVPDYGHVPAPWGETIVLTTDG